MMKIEEDAGASIEVSEFFQFTFLVGVFVSIVESAAIGAAVAVGIIIVSSTFSFSRKLFNDFMEKKKIKNSRYVIVNLNRSEIAASGGLTFVAVDGGWTPDIEGAFIWDSKGVADKVCGIFRITSHNEAEVRELREMIQVSRGVQLAMKQ